MWPRGFLEFSSHTMFEIEERRTIKWKVMLDILVINTSFCFIFCVTTTDNKQIYNNSPFTITSPGNIIVLSYDYNEHFSLDSQVLYFSFLYYPLNYCN